MAEFKDWILKEMVALAGNYKGSFFQRLVTAQYMLMPRMDESALPAFRDLAEKLKRQHEFLQSKFTFTPTPDDPYKSMKQMTQLIQAQKDAGVRKPNFRVFAEPPAGTAGREDPKDGPVGHPALSNDENVMLRGVHDALAHYAGQHPFTARGEIGSYNRHLKTLCNRDQAKGGKCLAAQALFTDLVAQTSCYYIYGSFVEQKVGILYDFDHYNVGHLAPNSGLNNFFYVQAKNLVPRPDFRLEEFRRAYPALAGELLRQEALGKSKVPLVPLPRD